MKVLFLTTLIFVSVLNQDVDEYEESVAVELQLEDYDLLDACDEIAETTKKAQFGYGFTNKIEAELRRGQLVQQSSLENLKFENNVPYNLIRNWTLLTKTGDFLLPQGDFKSLIQFQNVLQEESLQSPISCLGKKHETNCFLSRQEYLDELGKNRNATRLNQTWSTWQEKFSNYKSNFSSNLELINNALSENDAHTARNYWEILSECEDCYSKADQLWKEVEPLYRKVHEFVRVRLNNYYKLNQNESTIPVYLLGSDLGTDWSRIADIILPHPYLLDEVQTELKFYTTKEAYKLAETATETLQLGTLGSKFWSKSIFNSFSCGPHLFSYCGKEYTEMITCKNLNWTEYLDIHETVMKVALRNQEYLSLPRQEMRFNIILEALHGLGPLIAVHNLPAYDFIPRTAFKSELDEYNRKNTALLLTALRILPKLPYYLLADKWRLEEVDFSYGNHTEMWWKKRADIQGVRGVSNLEADYLNDDFIGSNKPHLSKFMGIFIQFQLLDHYQRHFATENGTFVNFIQQDENFKTLIHEIPSRSWFDLISFHYAIDEVSSSTLLEYFAPLEKYLEETISLEQVRYSTTPKIRTTTPKPTKPRKTNKIVKSNSTNMGGERKNLTTTTIKSELMKSNQTKDVEVTTTANHKLTILFSIAGSVVVAVVLYIIVRKCNRRRAKTNNRRFET